MPLHTFPPEAGAYLGWWQPSDEVSYLLPQIAGSYRGSYFSMTGLLIPEIAVWSLHRCRLVSQACLPSWFPFWAALGCRCRLVYQACLPSWFPFWAALGCRCCVVSQLVSYWKTHFANFSSEMLFGVYAGVISYRLFRWKGILSIFHQSLSDLFLFYPAGVATFSATAGNLPREGHQAVSLAMTSLCQSKEVVARARRSRCLWHRSGFLGRSYHGSW